MKLKQIVSALVFMVSITGFAQKLVTPVEMHGRLQVEGVKITSALHGDPVQLRGMSFFWSQWGDGSKYYTKGVVDQLVDDWKINVIRIAMGVNTGADSSGYIKNKATEKAKVITIIDAAIARGIYVIIDWHSHDANLELAEAKTFFAEMAQLYGEYPNVIYEVFNEPIAQPWATSIKPYCESVIDTIREHDADNLIICGTRNWSQEVEEVAANKIVDNNVAYTLHYYAASHKDNLRAKAQRAIDKGVPLFVTEFGTCESNGDGIVDKVESNLWWQFLKENDISWCNWSVSDKAEAASILTPGSANNGDWSLPNYTESGLFVRNELRYDYEVPQYDNLLLIEAQFEAPLIHTDSTFEFKFSSFYDGVLLEDSLVEYTIEVSNGGLVTNGLFTPNGDIGEYKLFVTAIYDTLVSTSTYSFIVSDIPQGEIKNGAERTVLALYFENDYALSTSLVYPDFETIAPTIGDSVVFDTIYHWKETTVLSGVLGEVDSAVRSFYAVYIVNPVTRLAKINTPFGGTSKVYLNGRRITKSDNVTLLGGDNILLVETTGAVDTSFFTFEVLTTEGNKMDYLSYSLSTTNSYDCAKVWNGTAYINPECGCLGGNTGKEQCPGPFSGEPALIPGIIESENYDWGGKGVGYFDATPGNNGSYSGRNPDDVDISPSGDVKGGPNVGWIDQGEWLVYTVEVLKTGKYLVDFRVASNLSFGEIDLKIGSKSILRNRIKVASTGGWTAWKTVQSDTLELTAGVYALKFEATGGAFNINYMEFHAVAAVGLTNELSIASALYPNPFKVNSTLEVQSPVNYFIYSLEGIEVESGFCTNNCTVGKDLEKGMYLLELVSDNKKATHRIIKE